MSERGSISFESVHKRYVVRSLVTSGITGMILKPAATLRSIREGRYFDALTDMNLRIEPGESVGVIGRNGAGKSTLLGLIAGVIRPDSGRVEVGGPIAPLLELGAGFHVELTGRENIQLNAVLLGLTRAQIAEQLDSVIEFSEIGEYIDRPIRTYSSGMLSRLGFAVAVHLDPAILLIDEVLAVGDEAFRRKCLAKMDEFREQGVTLVFVTHEMEQVVEHCSRAIHIERGRIVNDGDPRSVVDAYVQGGADEHDSTEASG